MKASAVFLIPFMFTAVVGVRPAEAETIEVRGCQDSMEHVVEAADGTWWCERGPSGEIDQSGDSDPYGGGDDGVEYGKGGGSKVKNKNKGKGGGGGGGGGGKAAHRKICQACRASESACEQAAKATEQSCRQAGERMAEWRCVGSGKVKDRGGLTPWGCGTYDLYEGRCPGVEAPWDEKEQWHPLRLSSDDVCMDAWRLPHSAGTVASSAGDEFSATFKGVGAKTTSTVTSTLQLTGRNGYLGACANVSSSLVDQCIAEESKCFAENACSPEEEP